MKATAANTIVNLSQFITVAEAMQRSGLSHSQITYLCRKGPASNGLSCIKVAPRLWLVQIASLEEYMSTEHKRGAKPKTKPTD